MLVKKLIFFNKFSTILIPKKILKKQGSNNIAEIANYFSIKGCEEEQQESIQNKYIKHWINYSQHNNRSAKQYGIIDLLKTQRRLKYMDVTKKLIAGNYKYYNNEVDLFINNFFMFILGQMNHFNLSKLTFEQTKYWQNQILEIVNSINHFAYFMKKNKQFCMKYLNLMFFIHGKAKIYDHNDFNLHLKQVLDSILTIPKQQFNPKQIIFLFSFISTFSVHVWYYQKADIILSTLWNNLPKKWQQMHNIRQRILKSINNLGIQSAPISQKTWKLFLQPNAQQTTITSALIVLLRILQITPQNCNQQKIKKQIKKLTNSQYKSKFFQRTVHEFYRAQVWLPEFWIPFFNFGMVNFQTFTLYNMFVIFQLLQLTKQNIPEEVYILGKQFQQKVKKQYKEITILDIQKQYERQYSTYFRKLNCQAQLANSFRLLNKGQVRTEVSVGIFSVDILINNKFVIEVNGGSHYLQNIETGQKRLSLKSRFRQELLPKMGFHVFNVNVMQFNEGSFEIISSIYKQIAELEQKQKQDNK